MIHNTGLGKQVARTIILIPIPMSYLYK